MPTSTRSRLSCAAPALAAALVLAIVSTWPVPPAGAQSRNADDYVIIGKDSVHVANEATVNGSVAAVSLKGRLKVGLGSTVSDGNAVVARKTKLGGSATVHDVYANVLSFKSGQTTITGDIHVPVAPPVFATETLLDPDPFDPANFPASWPVTCGLIGKNVEPGETATLAPGAYDRVRVRPGGKLVLLGGSYDMCRLDAEGVVEVSGPVTINIRDRFGVGRDGQFGPAAGLSGNDIQINLEGRKKVRIGDGSEVEFRLFAPNSTIKVGRAAEVRGQLISRKFGCSRNFRISPSAASVQPPLCGNGTLDAGETCDPPGGAQPPSGNPCTPACVFCGDGIVQTGEQCDDANANDTDACANDCMVNSNVCGDGDIDPGETCDPPGGALPPNGNPCAGTCTFCGDGMTQAGEQCDDANTDDGDACANDCTLNPVPGCGNGQIDPGETCEPPGAPQSPNGNPCTGACTFCGDGLTQAGEQCDDGNSNDADTCTNACLDNDPNMCGDGDIDPGETCDPPGNAQSPNGNVCRNECTFCGDGAVNGNEECDDGNSNDADACSNTCQANNPTTCGDGSVDPGETCDPPGIPQAPLGNLCRDDCGFCGDGIVNGNEECEPDDDEDDNSSACDADSEDSSSCTGFDDGVNSQDSSSEEDSSSDDASSACDASSAESSSCGGPADGENSTDSSSADDSSSETDGVDATNVQCLPDCTFPDDPDDDSSSCDADSASSSSCGGPDTDSAGGTESGSSDDSRSDAAGADNSTDDTSSDIDGSDDSSSNDH